MTHPQLTVRQLIEKLGQVPNLDAAVALEGCDCYTNAAHVVAYTRDDLFVLIGHTDNGYQGGSRYDGAEAIVL